MTVTSADFPAIRWKGHWIWAGEAQIPPGSPFAWDRKPRPEAHALFRRTFTLDQVPRRVPARITADSRYMLFVNGVFIGHGPARSQPRRMKYDPYDLAPHLIQGENLIAVLVKYHGQPRTDWSPAVANATLGKTGVLVFEADLGTEWLVSDDTWLSRLGRGWSEDGRDPKAMAVTEGIPVECFDARAEPAGWHLAGHDTQGWPPAQKIVPVHIGGRGKSQPPSDPYGPLFARDMAHLGGEIQAPKTLGCAVLAELQDLSSPSPAVRAEGAARAYSGDYTPASLPAKLTLPNNSAALYRLDFGRIVAGFVTFELNAPSGTVFDFYYAEAPPNRPPEFGATGGNRYICRGTNDLHRVFDKKGFRFAYILVHGATGEIGIKDFRVEEHHYPWSGACNFWSSDQSLGRLYQAGRRTVQLNSWDSFIDCPTREQRAWVGDAVVHQMVHLATNADWRLAWAYLDLGNSPRSDGILPMSVAGDVENGEGFTIPDWSLHWVHGLWNMHRFDGDRAKIKALMPTAERILRWYLPYLGAANVLEDVPEWNLIDWSSLYSEGQSAIVTALWARGLRDFAELAEWLGENASAAWANDLLSRLAQGFELFWDETRGLYVDHAIDGTAQPQVNQLAGALAIVSGLAPQSRWNRIIEAITDPARLVVRSWMFPGEDAPPSERGERFRRMTRGGLVPDWEVTREIVMAEPFMSYVVHDAILAANRVDLLPKALEKWHDFLTEGYDTFGENWGVGTRVHGWSSTPARDLIHGILGITPAAPGYASARIAPRLLHQDWMRGSAPTPVGPISLFMTQAEISITSPIPFELCLSGQETADYPAGTHVIPLK